MANIRAYYDDYSGRGPLPKGISEYRKGAPRRGGLPQPRHKSRFRRGKWERKIWGVCNPHRLQIGRRNINVSLQWKSQLLITLRFPCCVDHGRRGRRREGWKNSMLRWSTSPVETSFLSNVVISREKN